MANKSDQSSNIKFIQQYSYDRNEKLGQGSFGTVYLGHSTHDASKVYAIKVIPITLIQNDPELQENLFNEMKVMMLLSHENIIRRNFNSIFKKVWKIIRTRSTSNHHSTFEGLLRNAKIRNYP